MSLLTLEFVTPDGHTESVTSVEKVVFRRFEADRDEGAEVGILPRHAPILIRVPCSLARYVTGGETTYLAVAGGFAEVRDDHVLVVTPRFDVTGAGPGARELAQGLADGWRKGASDFQSAMVGI